MPAGTGVNRGRLKSRQPCFQTAFGIFFIDFILLRIFAGLIGWHPTRHTQAGQLVETRLKPGSRRAAEPRPSESTATMFSDGLWGFGQIVIRLSENA
ncbi:hypothetical protein IR141_08920 [Neisseria sp. 19428wB4_WF04]|nr:hypothetical protein [Neisseria sp. 19428wB4_WF04]